MKPSVKEVSDSVRTSHRGRGSGCVRVRREDSASWSGTVHRTTKLAKTRVNTHLSET